MAGPGSLASRAASGTAWTAVAQTGRQAMSVAAVAVLARLLAPADFGLLAMVTAVTALLEVVSELGLSAATVQRRELTEQQTQALFWINALFGLALSVIVAAGAPLLAWFYGRPELTRLAPAVGIGFLVGGLGVQPRALLVRQLRFRTLGLVDLGSWLAANVAAIAVAGAGGGVWALVVQIVGAQALQTVGGWVCLPWRPAWPGRAEIRGLLEFGGQLVGFNVLNYFARNLDNVLVGRLRGSEALGYYSRAYQLLTYPISAINAPLSGVMLATLSRLQGDLPRFRAAYIRASRAMVALAFPAIALMFALREEVVLTLYGGQWAPAVPIFGILALAALPQPIGNSCGWIFIAAGRPDRQLRWGLVAVPVTCLGFAIGARWGPLGVAAGYAIAMAVLAWPMAWYAYRTVELGVWEVCRHSAAQAGASLLAGAAAYSLRVMLPAGPTARLLVCSLVGSLAYLCGLSLLWSGWWQELREIVRLVRGGGETQAL